MESELLAFTALLLTSRAWRRRFTDDPAATATAYGLVACEHAQAVDGLRPAQLERQADVLRMKRYHEVTRLMPAAIAALKDEALPLFDAYFEGYWPQGAARHQDDARAFAAFLKARGSSGK